MKNLIRNYNGLEFLMTSIKLILTVRKAPYDESQIVEHRKTLI